MEGKIRAAIYVRVSTASKTKQVDAATYVQNPEVQEQPLRELVTQRGWDLFRVYSDRASGAAERRPGLDALMADARRGLFQVVVVWRFDRFARSVKQLVLGLEEFRALGIDFVSHQEALDSSTPLGKAMFTIIGAMAELERNIIRERVLAGMEHARRNGTKSGQPVGRPKAVFDRDEVVKLRQGGLSWRQIASKLRVGAATVRRAYKEGKTLQAALNGEADSPEFPATQVDQGYFTG
ncbi:MAG: recombinase family protein [Acidobacteriia bacterium]|nr:recombinase family protein [Terriglobia bacterium]